MRRRSVIAGLLFLLVFVLGGVTGAGASRVLTSGPRRLDLPPVVARREAFLTMVDRRVGTTAEERAALARIYDEHVAERTALLREIEPRFGQLRRRMHDEMRGAVAPERREAFDRAIQSTEDRWLQFLGLLP